MFIHVMYKDPPELSLFRRTISTNEDLDIDESVDKDLLVNPICPIRVMLEYIRKRCKLGIYTIFDLCDESGSLKGFFHLPTWAYATEHFVHRKTYYVIVFKTENDKQLILPQLNRQQPFYRTLLDRVNKFVSSGEVTSVQIAIAKAAGAPTEPTKNKIRRRRRTSDS